MEANISEPWSRGKRIIFRFLFIYLILYASPFPLGFLFGENGLSTIYFEFWKGLVVWTGKYILALDYEITVMPNGSGDTTFNYVQVLLFFLIALASAVIWSVLDRKHLSYERLFYWLTVYLRYYLGMVMLGYGFAKLIPTQFPFPFADRLMQPIGDLSPMGLLWTFMGYSKTYNIFAGMGEVVGGLLLFFRRTTLLGAMVLAVVLINVVMLNFSYDVPVKLYSLHLFLITLFILAPYAPRLWKVLVLHQPVKIEPVVSLFGDRWKNVTLLIFKIGLIGFVVTNDVTHGLDMRKRLIEMANPYSFAAYDVDTFVLRGDTVPVGVYNQNRWKRVLVNGRSSATIEYMDGVQMWQPFAADTVLHTITIGKGYAYHFQTSSLDSTRILWKGLMGKDDSLKLVVRKKKMNFLLVNRGFHWINEYPFNR